MGNTNINNLKLFYIILLFAVILGGCARHQRTPEMLQKYSDKELCLDVGKMEFTNNKEQKNLLIDEIKSRNIEKLWCEEIATAKLNAYREKQKTQLCQQLGNYYYNLETTKYLKILKKVEEQAYYDDECVIIAEFTIKKHEKKEQKKAEKRQRLGAALSSMNKPGTKRNPIHIRID
ncbi:MAG: hypothetical protein KKB30_15885 [Proteobacteria bacterium]|nr:hypothetical protein [Pseudomonadota bacterium]MBU1717197.1 hypothetical protein [Pseudomonadota bacterium]